MKQILQIILNAVILVSHFAGSICLLLWHGKLIKVSPYHMFNTKYPDIGNPMDEFETARVCISEEQVKRIKKEAIRDILNSDEYSDKMYETKISKGVINRILIETSKELHGK